jgi:hypothetical protein
VGNGGKEDRAAALPVAEETHAADRRRGAHARGEGGQRCPHRHLVLSSVVAVESTWDKDAVENGAR